MEDSGKNLERRLFKNKENSQYDIPFESMEQRISDAGTQFKNLNLEMFGVKTIEEIKELIKNTNFKNLEEYTGKTREELNKVKPGVYEEYDSIIEGLKNPNLTMEEFNVLMDRTTKNIIY